MADCSELLEELRKENAELKLENERLREKTVEYEFILDNLPTIVFHSLDGLAWFYSNRGWTEDYGYTREQSEEICKRGDLYTVCTPAGDQTALSLKAQQLLQTGKLNGMMNHVHHRDNREIAPFYLWEVRHVKYEEKDCVLGVATSHLDPVLSEADRLQQQSYKMLNYLVEQMDLVVVRVAPVPVPKKGNTHLCQNMSEQVRRYGYKPDDFWNPNTAARLAWDDVFPPIFDGGIDIDTLEKGQLFLREGKAVCASGEVRRCVVRGQFMPDDNGVMYLEGVVMDTTAEYDAKLLRESLEQQVEQRTSELRHAVDEAKGTRDVLAQFVSTLSHELRTPTHAIVMTTGMLADQSAALPDDWKEEFAVIKTNSEVLMMMLNQVLSYSRIQSGASDIALNRMVFDPRDCVLQVCHVLRGWQLGSGIAIRSEIDPHTPKAVKGDPSRVLQVLMNLAGNAAKFTLQGSVTVSCHTVGNVDETMGQAQDRTASTAHAESDDSSSVWLDFSVADTGLGIAPKDQQRVYQPFCRLNHTEARNQEGVGLGLAICQQLAKIMRGKLYFKSTGVPGEGTTFHFVLPFATTTANAQTHTFAVENVAKHLTLTPVPTGSRPSTPPRSGSGSSDADGDAQIHIETGPAPTLAGHTSSSIRVLVVDDNPAARVVMGHAFNRLHVAHTLVDSGLAAVNCMERAQRGEEEAYQLVFMDLRMPGGMDGFEATRQIRQLTAQPSASTASAGPSDALQRPIVCALSASIEESVKEAGSRAGCDFYLEKPLSFAGLKHFLRDVIGVSLRRKKTSQ